jgi:EAL and modified HD-GYP domain-containing signal transduction protein
MSGLSVHAQVHIGRQPIYDLKRRVVGYELLFRESAGAGGSNRSGAYATSQVVRNAFTEFGLDNLVGDRLCFINLTREFLTGELPLPFGPDQVVLEVLETVQLDAEVVAGVLRLAAAGYRLALDDFVLGSGHERLFDVASYVKLDLMATPPPELRAAVTACAGFGLTLVAERLETADDIEFARGLGFHLMQGYALGRPQTLSAGSLNPAHVRRLELFAALNAVDIDFERVVSIVNTDPALSVRILQATNSAQAGLSRAVSSIREAVALLGTARIRQWVALMVVSDVTAASDEHLAAMITRARLCQTVSERLGASGDTGFTVGLLAGIADLMDEPVAEMVARLPLAEPVAHALTRGDGPVGRALAVVRAYERNDASALAAAPVAEAEVARSYLSALGWSRRILDGRAGGR